MRDYYYSIDCICNDFKVSKHSRIVPEVVTSSDFEEAQESVTT
jgi:hypothetical protein